MQSIERDGVHCIIFIGVVRSEGIRCLATGSRRMLYTAEESLE